MSKKSKRKQEERMAKLPTAEDVRGIMSEPPANPAPKPKPTITTDLLADVRRAAMRASNDTAHNIAELESWRNEIDATIAFLRAQRK